MPYYADFSNDLPAPYKRKRIIFYQQGLKIYGLLPYILQRKLRAQFFSGSVSWGNVRISVGSFEANWTAVSYQQSPENVAALFAWLYKNQGFEAAIASKEEWDENIFAANVMRTPPRVWYPIDGEKRRGFLQIMERPEQDHIISVLMPAVDAQEDGNSTT